MTISRRRFTKILGTGALLATVPAHAGAPTARKAYVACMSHETNSFSPMPTSIQTFRDDFYYDPADRKGIEMIRKMMGTKGFIEQFAQLSYDVQIGPIAFAAPGGPCSTEDYEQIRDHILSDLAAAGPVDVVGLFLHGAQSATGYPDCESDLVARVRKIVGPKVPIGVLLDLHCDCNETLLREAIVVCCREYPHTDFDPRAAELAVLLDRARSDEISPVTVKRHIPMIDFFHTTTEPMRSLVADFPGMIAGDILSVSLMHGFPWSDQPTAGAYVVVVTDNAPETGRQLAEQIAQRWIPMRGSSRSRWIGLNDALDKAEAANEGPVVIADVADNPGGGAAGDSTFILAELLRRDMRNLALATIWDPSAVETAKAAGQGARLRLRIGGKVSTFSGDPIDLDVTIGQIFEQQSQSDACRTDTDVALNADGLRIVISNRRSQVFSPEVFARVGIEPESQDILVVKSSQHFRARFEPIATEIIYCDTPGTLTSDLAAVPFKNIPRPMWPLDDLKDHEM